MNHSVSYTDGKMSNHDPALHLENDLQDSEGKRPKASHFINSHVVAIRESERLTFENLI